MRELILLHHGLLRHGSVQAASKGIDRGSEFTVRLPLAAVATKGGVAS